MEVAESTGTVTLVPLNSRATHPRTTAQRSRDGIALTMRKRPYTKYQDPGQQVRVRSQDRVRIVKMASEKKR